MTIRDMTADLSDEIPPYADLGQGTERPMRIWSWQADQSGCGFYRVAEPMRALRRYGGHKVNNQPQVQGFVEFKMLGKCSGQAEICVIQRIVSLDTTPAVRRLRQPGTKLVYEIDDHMFAVDRRNEAAWKLYSQPATLDGLRTAASLCDLITVTRPGLAEVMEREVGVPAVVLPNLIDDEMLTMERTRADTDRVRIGWAGGQGHDSDFRTVYKIFRRFLARNRTAEFHCLGYDYRRPLGEDRVYFSTWTTPMSAYWRAIDFDIGVAPLLNNIFNRDGKTGLKALEYGALGIPTVATDLAPYRDVIIDGVTGFLIRHDWEWEKRLRDLVHDEAMRKEMGEAARAHIREHHSLARHWRRWEAVYARLLGIPHRTPELAPPLVDHGTTPYVLRRRGG